jgi:hypothetical protein
MAGLLRPLDARDAVLPVMKNVKHGANGFLRLPGGAAKDITATDIFARTSFWYTATPKRD